MKLLLEASLAEGQSLGIVAEGDAKVFATFTIGALKEIPRVNSELQGDEMVLKQYYKFKAKAAASPDRP